VEDLQYNDSLWLKQDPAFQNSSEVKREETSLKDEDRSQYETTGFTDKTLLCAKDTQLIYECVKVASDISTSRISATLVHQL
jgi:hypothetical protein